MEAEEHPPILLVEDDPDTQDSIKLLLEVEGHAVVTADDGEQALARLRSGLQPCLILLDLMMPRMDGFQFARAARQEPQFAAVPLVVYSGHHDPAVAAAAIGAVACLKKPINFDQLMSVIAAHC